MANGFLSRGGFGVIHEFNYVARKATFEPLDQTVREEATSFCRLQSCPQRQVLRCNEANHKSVLDGNTLMLKNGSRSASTTYLCAGHDRHTGYAGWPTGIRFPASKCFHRATRDSWFAFIAHAKLPLRGRTASPARRRRSPHRTV